MGLKSLLVGCEPSSDDTPVALDAQSLAVLTPHGVLNVLQPYLSAGDPPAIAPALFEGVLKHHCVVDMNITVYDDFSWETHERRGDGCVGRLRSGPTEIDVLADAHIDTGHLPRSLPDGIRAGARAAEGVLAGLGLSVSGAG